MNPKIGTVIRDLQLFKNSQKCFERVWKFFKSLQQRSNTFVNLRKVFGNLSKMSRKCLKMFEKI